VVISRVGWVVKVLELLGGEKGGVLEYYCRLFQFDSAVATFDLVDLTPGRNRNHHEAIN